MKWNEINANSTYFNIKQAFVSLFDKTLHSLEKTSLSKNVIHTMTYDISQNINVVLDNSESLC